MRSTPSRRFGATLALVVLSTSVACAEAGSEPMSDRARSIAVQREGLRAVLATMQAQVEIFPRKAVKSPRLLGPDERALAMSLWAAFADLLLTIEQGARDLDDDDEAFALRRAAFLARYRFAMEFIERVERDPRLDPLFDEAHPGMGLPERSYARLKFHYLNVARATEFAAIELLHRTRRSEAPPALADGAREDARRILELGRGAGPRMTAANAIQVVGDSALSAWLPAQEHVARWMGEVRVRRNGHALISEEQISQLRQTLEPGDILLQRREWFLTNAGIPGFWTHAALYVGTPEVRERYFADPEVRDWARSLGSDGFEALLRARHPEATSRSGMPESGHPAGVLEAIAEGVVFTSLEHSAGADSIAVLRARLSKREKAIALLRAFGYAGRPYDYNFDFATDAALVCSELVYKSFERATGTRGLSFPLESVAGRLMMTPNEIARGFSSTRHDTRRQLDFVWMLDGNERTGTSDPASEQTFATSWQRPKWHIVTAGTPTPADL